MSQGLSPCFPAGGDARTKVRAYLRGKGGQCAGGPGLSQTQKHQREEGEGQSQSKIVTASGPFGVIGCRFCGVKRIARCEFKDVAGAAGRARWPVMRVTRDA
jgi:hypothetical protein